MKGKQALLYCAIALPLSIGSTGCKDDSAAISALKDLTNQLSGQVAEQNEELTNLTETLETCAKDLAKAKDEAVVVSTSDATVDAPSLEGEATLQSLETLKEALNETIEEQKEALTELKAKVDQCTEDLEAAREEAEAAAAEEAAARAAAEEARKKAAATKKRKDKPTAVKEAEKTGAPTKGTRSRY